MKNEKKVEKQTEKTTRNSGLAFVASLASASVESLLS